MKKIILFIFVIVFLSSIALAYHGTSGNYEWRFFNDGFGANASSGNYEIRANAGGYPADTISVGAYSGNYQEYDLEAAFLAVQLVSPANGSSQTATNVNFIYNLNTTNNANCSLILNGANVYNDTNKTTGQQSITQILAIGDYNWSIVCNSSSNDNVSDTWYFSITSVPGVGAVSGGGGGGSVINAGPFYDITVGPLNVGEPSKITVNSPVSGELVVLYEKNGKWFYVTNVDVLNGLAFFTPDVPGKYRFDFRYINRLAASVEAIAQLGTMTERPFAAFYAGLTEQLPAGKAASKEDLQTPPFEEKPVAVVSEVEEKKIDLDITSFAVTVISFLALIILFVLFSSLLKKWRKHKKAKKPEERKKPFKEKPVDDYFGKVSTDLKRLDKEIDSLKKKYKF